MNILMCFAKGFGLLGGIVGGLAGITYLCTRLTRWLARRTSWDVDDIGLSVGLGVAFLAIGTTISLAFCGILK